MKQFKLQFGGKPTAADIERYRQSPNWKDGKFQNEEETIMSVSFWEIPVVIYKQLTNTKGRFPEKPLPVAPFDKEAFLADQSAFKFAWYGHSALLMRIEAQTILIDPMLGDNVTPIAPAKSPRFSENTLALIDDFPEIDLMIISHDHYDHLDLDSILKLREKTHQYFVTLGVKRHLVKWGVDPTKIKEFDWWDQHSFANIKITSTPTRHFSGRGLTDRAKSFWGGWAFQTENNNIWFSGDGGYGKHFKEIGERLGPFDFAFMESGQYNEKWRMIHMFPDESVQAALDANVKLAMPVHWGGFTLAQHSWKEPAEEFLQYCKEHKLNYFFPKLGELVDPFTSERKEAWWEAFR